MTMSNKCSEMCGKCGFRCIISIQGHDSGIESHWCGDHEFDAEQNSQYVVAKKKLSWCRKD